MIHPLRSLETLDTTCCIWLGCTNDLFLAGWLKPSAMTESVLKTHYKVEMVPLNLFFNRFFHPSEAFQRFASAGS
jgi:hypothetical protein